MQRKPVRAINNRKEELIGRRLYFGRFNKWWCTESTHYPTTFLLDHLIILLETLTITNFDSHARPYRKKNNSSHNHVMGLPKNGYERFSSTRNKSIRKGMGHQDTAGRSSIPLLLGNSTFLHAPIFVSRPNGLAPYVGCRRVVFVAQMATFCVVSATCRHKKMSCRLECLNDTTFDNMSGDSRHVGNFLIVV
jgi:hypothetical protein